MARALPLVVSVSILVGAWFLPTAAPSKVSALQSWELLDLPVGEAPADDAADDRPRLWEVICASPAARSDAGKLEVTLHGTWHRADPEFLAQASEPAPPRTENGVPVIDADSIQGIDDHGTARASIVRGLRQFVSTAAADDEVLAEHPEYADLTVAGAEFPVGDRGANFDVQLRRDDEGRVRQLVTFTVDDADFEPVAVERTWNPPGRVSIVPPVVAVVLAILLRKPLIALLTAVFAGAFLLRRAEGAELVGGIAGGLGDVFRKYLWNELVQTERIYIIGFVFFMLAMVGVMTRSGGIRGLMDSVARRAKNARGTQVATWIMGLVIFFDDYANTILVGSTMRPLTDRFKVSREKLAYIVDSTAAPVAGLSVFSTWIAFEVSTFNGQLPAAGMSTGDGYAVFLRTIPFSFYCFLTIYFVGLVALTGRDFGPMFRAEQRSRSRGLVLREGATPMVSEEATTMDAAPNVRPSPWRAILPLFTFMAVTLLEILRAGGLFGLSSSEFFSIEGVTGVLYAGSGSWPLLVGSLAGFLVAALGALRVGLSGDIVRSAWTTVRAMAVGFAILYLAWMIGAVCTDLGTAPFLTALIEDAVDGRLLPSLLFMLAGAVAFATGSSWSTMSILLPLVVGLAYTLGLNAELAPEQVESGRLLMVMSIGAVLSGAIFGDHCSPISDTTVMSSIASASDHIDHVRTQIPYALVTMLVSVVCGYFPATYYGLSPWLGLLLGAVILTVLLLVIGRPDEDKLVPRSAPGSGS